ncbi:MAG TPA: circadian clock KaiB family protein [Chitinophagaceae bacterium]|nr:circadian clock KaiB family protein [Chitinophagaceae bacterium]
MNRQLLNGKNKTYDDPYIFRLYVTGASPNSLRAIANTKNICEEYLNEKYELQIIDVHQQPLIAAEENIVALPLLIKKSPLPEKRLIGDMSDIERVLKSIGISNGKV